MPVVQLEIESSSSRNSTNAVRPVCIESIFSYNICFKGLEIAEISKTLESGKTKLSIWSVSSLS